jgi:putative copper export protein
MLPLTLESFRLFLHVTAATVWVGGQLTLLGLLPILRELGPDAPKAAARRFNVIAWSAFGVLFVTGIWNLLAESAGSKGTAWNATLGLKLVMVAATGIAAAFHAGARSKVILAIGGAVSLLAGLAAVLLGILLSTASA